MYVNLRTFQIDKVIYFGLYFFFIMVMKINFLKHVAGRLKSLFCLLTSSMVRMSQFK